MVERHFVARGSIVFGAVVAFFGLSLLGDYHELAPPSPDISPAKSYWDGAYQEPSG